MVHTVSPELTRYENRMIMAQATISHAAWKIAQQVSRGLCDSEVVGAIADLHAAANAIDQARKDFSSTRTAAIRGVPQTV